MWNVDEENKTEGIGLYCLGLNGTGLDSETCAHLITPRSGNRNFWTFNIVTLSGLEPESGFWLWWVCLVAWELGRRKMHQCKREFLF